MKMKLIFAIILVLTSFVIPKSTTGRNQNKAKQINSEKDKKKEYKLYEDLLTKKCKNKNVILKQGPKEVTTNGCGPAFLDKYKFGKLAKLFGKKTNDCCDLHDKCYGKCIGGGGKKMYAARKTCDTEMYICMKKSKSKRALFTKGGFKGILRNYGKGAYKDAQEDFCICPKK
jgi:hypothetical protein